MISRSWENRTVVFYIFGTLEGESVSKKSVGYTFHWPHEVDRAVGERSVSGVRCTQMYDHDAHAA